MKIPLWKLWWQTGTCNGHVARRNRITGEVHYVLWKAGEQGHTEDYWYPMHKYHWPHFTKESP